MEKSPPTYRIRGTSAGNLLKVSADSLLACQPKPWRRLVEVAGVEIAASKSQIFNNKLFKKLKEIQNWDFWAHFLLILTDCFVFSAERIFENLTRGEKLMNIDLNIPPHFKQQRINVPLF